MPLEPFSTFGVQTGESDNRAVHRFEDVGLADASNAVLARRHNTRDILTLDERHLLMLRRPHNLPLRLLPAGS